VFGEVRVPLLANDAAVLSAAARYSDYSDFGSKVTPQFGAEVRPIPGLLLRASYAQAFRAPTLANLHGARTVFNLGINDPLNGNMSVVVPAVSGGNPNLDPETGDSKSLGVVWSGTPGLVGSATYYWLNEDNRVSAPTAAALLANPTLFPGRVVRDAMGKLLSLDESSINFGSLRSEGFDIDLSYTWATPLGDVRPLVDVTATTKFLAAVRPDQPLVNRLSTATFADAWAPRWKGAAGAAWNRGPFSASLSGRYLGRYLDYQPPANGHQLGNFVLWDAYARYDLGRDLFNRTGFGKSAYVAVAAKNLFDRSPQYSNALGGNIGYDPFQADLLGRLVTITFGAAW
jgi:iron complex outermembrane receptor protein